LEKQLGRSPYDADTLAQRSLADLAVARLLTDALRNIRAERLDAARGAVERARSLAPQYFEVHRVEAFLKTREGDTLGARWAYEAAIEAEPRSAPLRLWYGRFLIGVESDAEAALSEFQEAMVIDPDSPEPRLEVVHANLVLGDFAAASELLRKLAGEKDHSYDVRKRTQELLQRFYQSQAEKFLSERRGRLAIRALLKLRHVYGQCPTELVDQRMKSRLERSAAVARSAGRVVAETEARRVAVELADWYVGEARSVGRTEIGRDGEEGLGEIRRVKYDEGYGFILVSGSAGVDLFFHRSELASDLRWEELRAGVKVRFVFGRTKKGRCALDVRSLREERV
jgi:Tfp pilus assembly protein PilF/cold shock CspA family protein